MVMYTPIRAALNAILVLGVGPILVGLAFLPFVALANDDIAGRASVIDGDTLEIRGQRIRLWGVDAPEGQQRCLKDRKPLASTRRLCQRFGWLSGGSTHHVHTKGHRSLQANCRHLHCRRRGHRRMDGTHGVGLRLHALFKGLLCCGAIGGYDASPRSMAGRVRDALGVEAQPLKSFGTN